jgi:hypothetical protein
MPRRGVLCGGVLALAALCLGSQAGAEPAVVAVARPATTSAAASSWDELAGVVVGSSDTSSDRMLDAIIAEIGKGADFGEMEASFPGLTAALGEALRPIMHEESERMMPQYRAELAALYAQTLSAAEASDALQFMRGGAMSRFRNQLLGNRSVSAVVRDIAAQQDVSAASLQSDVRSSAIEAMLQMEPADVMAINAFYRSPIGAKLTALNPQKLAIDQKWTNTLSPGAEARLQTIVVDAMAGHIAKTDPKMAKTIRKAMRKEMGNPAGT